MAETEGTDGRGGRDRMAEAEGGTGWLAEGTGWQTGWQKQKGPDGRGGRDRMAEAAEGTGAEGTGWQKRKRPDDEAKRKKRERPKRKEQGNAAGPDGKQKWKDWNLMALEGTGCSIITAEGMAESEGTGWPDGRGRRDRMAEGTGWLAEGTRWQTGKGPDGRDERDWMAEVEGTGWLVAEGTGWQRQQKGRDGRGGRGKGERECGRCQLVEGNATDAEAQKGREGVAEAQKGRERTSADGNGINRKNHYFVILPLGDV